MGDVSATPWAKGIGAITLFVEDPGIAKEFYQRVFGLPVVFEDPESAVFKFGNTLVNLLKVTAAGHPGHPLYLPQTLTPAVFPPLSPAAATAPGRRG